MEKIINISVENNGFMDFLWTLIFYRQIRCALFKLSLISV